MKKSFSNRAWALTKETFSEWSDDNAPRLSAALSYYTAFSIAPLLVIVIGIAGLIFGQEAARGQIVGQIEHLVGHQGAEAIQMMLAGASRPSSGIIATVVGIATLLIGATGVFAELQDSLNTIWEVKRNPQQGVWGTVRQRFFSFTMVLGTGFLLLVSLVLSAGVAAFADVLDGSIPGFAALSKVLTFGIGLAVTTLVFALIFKVVPDVKVEWRDVWIGALVTALLFSLGRFALGEYLGRGAFSSSYGAVASLVVVLFWVYYSAQIMLLGAEFTQVHARARGRVIEPDRNAVRISLDQLPGQAPEAEREPVTVPRAQPPSRLAPSAKRSVLAGLITGFLLGRRRTPQH